MVTRGNRGKNKQKRAERLGPLASATIRELGLGSAGDRGVASVAASVPTIAAFLQMRDDGVSALAVLAPDGSLVRLHLLRRLRLHIALRSAPMCLRALPFAVKELAWSSLPWANVAAVASSLCLTSVPSSLLLQAGCLSPSDLRGATEMTLSRASHHALAHFPQFLEQPVSRNHHQEQ